MIINNFSARGFGSDFVIPVKNELFECTPRRYGEIAPLANTNNHSYFFQSSTTAAVTVRSAVRRLREMQET